MRAGASSYAPKSTRAIETERVLRDRLSRAQQDRRDRTLEALDEATLEAMRTYQREKARAARQGKPTLPTYERWRSNVLPEETPTK